VTRGSVARPDDPDSRPQTPTAGGYLDALAVGEFRALFAAYTVSMLGDIVAAVALTVLVYERRHRRSSPASRSRWRSSRTCSAARCCRVSSTESRRAV
jgi:hypothetical protein